MTKHLMTAPAEGEAPPAQNPHHDRRWLILAVLGLAQLMVVLDATVVNIALPTAQRALSFSNADRQWIVTGYALSFGSLLLLGGDVYKRQAEGDPRDVEAALTQDGVFHCVLLFEIGMSVDAAERSDVVAGRAPNQATTVPPSATSAATNMAVRSPPIVAMPARACVPSAMATLSLIHI